MAVEAKRLANGGAGELAVVSIDAADQFRCLFARLGEAVVGEQLDVAVGDVGQRLGGGTGVGGRHVCHAVVSHALLDKHRVVVHGRAGGLCAAALVDGDIHQHAALAHAAQHLPVNQLGRLGPGHEHRANQQVHARQLLEDVRLVGVQRVSGVQRDVF